MVRKALVDLEGPVFREFAQKRAAWALEDAYRCAHTATGLGFSDFLCTLVLSAESCDAASSAWHGQQHQGICCGHAFCWVPAPGQLCRQVSCLSVTRQPYAWCDGQQRAQVCSY